MRRTHLAHLAPVLFLLMAAAISACKQASPSALSSPERSATPALSASSSSKVQSSAALSPTSSDALPLASATAAPSASASSGTSDDPLRDAPTMVGPDGKPLEQTDAKPSTSSLAFKKRMELLWQAIVANDSSIAEPAFFPMSAYVQVKDIKKPEGDWKSRLLKNFGRDVREYHKKLGSEPAGLHFVGVDIDEPRVKWMDRGKEGNKLGYFRVTRSKIRYADPAGKEHTLDLSSLISWRGEWFVVHLHGFK